MKPSCIALDFDQTLAYYEGGYSGLFNIFVSRGVPQQIIEEAYWESRAIGSSIDTLLTCLKRRGAFAFDEKTVKKEFNEWISQSLRLYTDAISLIERIKRSDTPLVLVTAGNPIHQKTKVELMNIPYDKLFLVAMRDGKSKVIRELMKVYGTPILYVDDSVEQLDGVRHMGIQENEVHTFRISRPDGMYRRKESKFSHKEISDLHSILV